MGRGLCVVGCGWGKKNVVGMEKRGDDGVRVTLNTRHAIDQRTAEETRLCNPNSSHCQDVNTI